jgi:thiamine kinase-like enzyme
MPIGYGPGDHRMIVVDFTSVSMVGEEPQAIVRPGARRLNSKDDVARKNYISVLEELLERHKLGEKMLRAHRDRDMDPAQFQKTMDKVDQEAKEFMVHAEKKCRKLKCGKIPFSPEASLWIKRCQFYRTLLRALSGNKVNRGNLKRLARRLKLLNPFSLSAEEVTMRLRECKQQCKYFQVHGQRYRRRRM